MKILCGLATLCTAFIWLKPDTKRCKPHGTPSTWPLEDQEFHMSFSLADSHSYPGKNILTKRFSHWHTRNIPALNNTAQWHWDIQGTAWQRDFYEILTRSLRDLYEIKGKAAGISSALPFSAVRLSTHFYSSIQFSSLLFSSTGLSSVWAKLLRSHPHEFLSQKEYASKTCVPLQGVWKITMPQTIDSSSKNDMYIMDFPTAHRLQHKKTTAAQVTTVTL